MKLKDKVKIECIRKGINLRALANHLGITRQNLYHRLTHNNIKDD